MDKREQVEKLAEAISDFMFKDDATWTPYDLAAILYDAGYRLVPELKLLSAGEMLQVIWEAGKKYEEAGGDLARIAQIQRFIWIAQAQLEKDKRDIEGE